MRVLVACEFSGIVRNAFLRRGHDAYSCDLLPTESTSHRHIQGNALDHLRGGWDLLIAHPPCTYLAVSGARWFEGREQEQEQAAQFALDLWNAPINLIALENPISMLTHYIRKPDQIVQPWQFGHGEVKSICLWLKFLPKLAPTEIVEGRVARVHTENPGPDRWKRRSRFFQGIAGAMADQWGTL